MDDEKGFALTELLAAMAILFIISAVIYSIFFGFNKNYQQITDKNRMDQAANITLATIKQYHQNYDSYKIRYDGGKAYIGETAANQLLDDSKYKIDLKLGESVPQDFDDEVIIHSSKPIAVHLKLTNAAGQSYEVETIIKRY